MIDEILETPPAKEDEVVASEADERKLFEELAAKLGPGYDRKVTPELIAYIARNAPMYVEREYDRKYISRREESDVEENG